MELKIIQRAQSYAEKKKVDTADKGRAQSCSAGRPRLCLLINQPNRGTQRRNRTSPSHPSLNDGGRGSVVTATMSARYDFRTGLFIRRRVAKHIVRKCAAIFFFRFLFFLLNIITSQSYTIVILLLIISLSSVASFRDTNVSVNCVLFI